VFSLEQFASVIAGREPPKERQLQQSEADLRLTRRLSEAARILQIQMLDYVIIGHPINCRQGYFSFKETGTIG